MSHLSTPWLSEGRRASATLALCWIAFVLLVRYPALWIPAFAPDNILSLSLGDRDFVGVFGRFFEYLPYYRPVGTLSVWAQYSIHGLNAIHLYFLVNLVLVGLCAHLFTLLLLRAGAGLVPSLLAGAFFAVHPNTLTFGTIIGERMNTLFIAFGFLAILAWCALVGQPRPSPAAVVAMCVFLLLSALSKEVGLAFSFVIFVASLWMLWKHERRSLAWTAGGAVAVVGVVLGLHITIVGFRPGISYAECHAFFAECWVGSFEELGWLKSAGALLYAGGANVAAAFFPFAFDGDGTLRSPLAYSGRTVVFSILFTGAVVFGAIKAPPVMKVASIALIVGHGMASATLFRFRNHMASDAGAIALACFGLSAVCAHRGARTWVRTLLVCLVVAIVGYRAVLLNRDSWAWVQRERAIDPEVAREYVRVGASERVIEVQRTRFVGSGG